MAHRLPDDTTRPTQVARPWRATARVVAVTAIALLPALPELAAAANIDAVPTVIALLTIAAAVQRVLTVPAVDRVLARYGLGAADTKDYYPDE